MMQPKPISGAAMVANNAVSGASGTPATNAKVPPKNIRKQANALTSAKFLIMPNPPVRLPHPNLQQ